MKIGCCSELYEYYFQFGKNSIKVSKQVNITQEMSVEKTICAVEFMLIVIFFLGRRCSYYIFNILD